ncbi:hypothetical protein E3N88_09706 [Mikania micrantha]|uniref:Uncharacterized protein n=1 Tax=Mikania micrantha TaxID=192012 RepID=A0A5N6PJT7_9ASTR|nr:hypothetical protein E3N88_09706 [Mikania micrantha]
MFMWDLIWSNLIEYSLSHRREAKFIQNIVTEISLKLHLINWSIDEKLVGMEERVKNVISSLQVESEDDVRMIGIWGMGGAGKTTLARAVFDHISIWFEGKSFVENVRERSKGMGLKELQRQLLKDVLNDQSIDVNGASDGIYKMKKMMPGRKVLVVLDDVDHIEQLEALAGELTWFKPGSRIFITTRDKQVLVAQGVHVDNIYNISLLSDEEAICLFNRHAFRSKFPIQGYEEKLSRRVVHYAAGLPLTIKVLGSLLCGRTEPIWLDTLKRLKTIPLKETLKKLEISYDGLEEDQKEIFLDVACILKGESKENAIRILESCGFHAQIGLDVLEQKSLINIMYNGYLGMHDHIEEMGRNIACRLHPGDPNRHSRLWVKEEIEEILVNDLGTEDTRSMILNYMDIHPAIVMKSLRKMKKIIFLFVNYYSLPTFFLKKWKIDVGGVQYLPDTLRCLIWADYPFFCLPKTFQADNLVYLKMPRSCISQLWEGGERKFLKKLKFVDLSYSKLRTFDLGMTRNLETLDLRSCIDLVELQIPVPLPMLKVLDLSGSMVSNLNLEMTPNIENLRLKGCEDLVELQMSVALPMLNRLYLSDSKVSNLNLGLTPNLKVLELKDCYYLQEIHAPVGCLKNLTRLNLSGCLRFEYFWFGTPCVDSLATLKLNAESLDICPLHPNSNLPKFKFRCIYNDVLPSSSGNLEKLLSFGLCACTNLESFSASICGLQHLTALTLEGCIPELPKDLWKLESLDRLTLRIQEIKHLPDCICMLKHLKSLDLGFCGLLEQLPMDLGGLECLEELRLTDCTSLRDIPDSICQLKCLKLLHISRAGICCLPKSIIQLKHLKSVDQGFCELLEELPMDLEGLECLEEFLLRCSQGRSIIPSSPI